MTETREETRSSSPLKDTWLLMKPELTSLSVFTSICSAYLAIEPSHNATITTFFLLIFGTFFVGGGCGALNQYIEWELDAEMKRTQKRPIPDRRIAPRYAMMYGIFLSILGVAALFLINNLSGFLALGTIISYLFLYTPLKRISTVSTIIGAIPGAIPILIGWASMQNHLSVFALILFAVLFYWQIPHFYSLAWMYRADYQKAGFRLLSIVDESGSRVGKYVIINLILLIATSFVPVFLFDKALVLYGAVISGAYILWSGISFIRKIQTENSSIYARKLFFSSLVYLPVYFSSLVLSKMFE